MINEKNIVEIKQKLSPGQRIMLVNGRIFPVGVEQSSNSGFVQYGYIDSNGNFQALDLTGEKPVISGEPAIVSGIGTYRIPDLRDMLTFTLDEMSEGVEIQCTPNSNQPDHICARDIYYYTESNGEWKPVNSAKAVYTTNVSTGVESLNRYEIYLKRGGDEYVKFWNKTGRCNYGSSDDTTTADQFFMFNVRNGYVHLSGDISSMRNFNPEPLADSEFANLFGGEGVLTASGLKLPAMTLARFCYGHMFQSCIGLTAAPALPAVTLAEKCYSAMFEDCESLTVAPELPATELATLCYSYLFAGCTSLRSAPELKAPVLKDCSYYRMFYDCINLNEVHIYAENPWSTYIFSGAPRPNTDDWLYNVAAQGTLYCKTGCEPSARGEDTVPESWTVEAIY